MLKYIDKWSYINLSSPLLPRVSCNTSANFSCTSACISSFNKSSKSGNNLRTSNIIICARRRIRYDEDDDDDDDDDGDGEEYGNNEDIAMLEYYSQRVKEVALLVKAEVDEHDVDILIFKGFSSSLSHGTTPDLSRSIIPARGVIKSIDIVKGPFNPSKIEYVDKGLSWDTFKTQYL